MSTQKSKITGALTLAGIVAMLYALGSIGATDAEVREQTRVNYCEGVAIWRAEAQRGIGPERRAGRPEGRYNASDRCPDLPAKIQQFSRQRQQLATY